VVKTILAPALFVGLTLKHLCTASTMHGNDSSVRCCPNRPDRTSTENIAVSWVLNFYTQKSSLRVWSYGGLHFTELGICGTMLHATSLTPAQTSVPRLVPSHSRDEPRNTNHQTGDNFQRFAILPIWGQLRKLIARIIILRGEVIILKSFESMYGSQSLQLFDSTFL
jgi:hypothetical protein